ncbi:MAG: TonB-linked SusC/RagA family outer membrane protein [Marinoscillum sp.]|jgi:TonB-linked SusC/RagA family outer membrane protein
MLKCFFSFLLSLCLIGSAYSQTLTVSGIVKDLQEPLIGAMVIVDGTSNGVVTDINGKFSLQVEMSATILVSFIGYQSKEFKITSSQNLNIILESAYDELEEVVVIGYGSVKKSDLTGSVSSIKAEDLVRTAVSSIDQGIQGKAAGVVVSMGSGQPGARSSTRIRGSTSILGSNEPLYVIDGVIIATGNSISAVTGPSINPLESINPADVESIEVLKDASATAIYGARGANGVILVTTKRGKSGKAEVNIGYSQSWQELRREIPLLNAGELAILGNEAADNAGVPRRLIYASPTNLGVGINWQDEIFDIAPMTNLQVSTRGGKEGSTFSISGGFLDQQGILLNSSYSRGNVRINLDRQIYSKLSVGTSTNLTRSKLSGTVTDSEGAIPSSVTSWALSFNPGLPLVNANGDPTFENNTAQPSVGNPVQDALKTQQATISTRLLGNIFLKWDIYDWMSLKTSVGTEVAFIDSKSFIPNDIFRGQASNGQAALGESQSINQLWETTLSLNKTFGIHALSGFLGYTMQKLENEFIFLATSDFDDNRLGYNAVQAGKLKTLVVNGSSAEQLQSFLGRINYNLKEKYIMTASARVDGSSKFGAGNKYGFFPSVAMAWRVKEEAFLKNVEFVSDLKVRAGFGAVGNQGHSPYSSLGLLETTEAYFGENIIAKGSGQSNRENTALRWETTNQYDVGVDVGFFENRILLTADIYYKKTTNLLINAPLPYTSGFKEGTFNVGTMKNQGFELAINTFNLTRKLDWKTTVTMGWNRNEVLNINRDEGIFAESLLGISGWTSVEEGKPLNSFYGYKTAGIVQSSEDPTTIPHFASGNLRHGDRKYVDQNEDGLINADDIVLLGNAHPDFSFGVNNTLNYKSFSLSVFVQGVMGNQIVNFNRFGLESFNGTQNNSREALKRWTPENPSNTFPRATLEARPNILSDHQVEDGSYLRVKDITLSFDFRRLLASKNLKVGMFQLFVSGKNLITVTNYSGYDPEINRFISDALRFGADFGSYPSAKIYTTGLNITF